MKISLSQYPLSESLSFSSFCEKMRVQLSEEPADLHVFPELHSAELLGPAARSGEDEAREWRQIARHFDSYVEFTQTLAREKNAVIVAGTFPREVAGRLRNTCVIARPDAPALFQDKLFPTETERVAWEWEGGNRLNIFEVGGFRVVVLVCYDVEFPQISELLANAKPHLIVVPSCTSAHFGFHRVRWCAQARAIEHFAYVAATGTVGSLPTSPSFSENEGQAYVLTPSEKGYSRILAEGTLNRAEQVFATLDFVRLVQDRARVGAYPARDQTLSSKRIEFGGELNGETVDRAIHPHAGV